MTEHDERSSRLVAAGVVTATLAATALLAPWVALGSRRFSSLDLISSASAFELIEGRRKTLVLAAWMLVPVLVAASYVFAAIGRRRLLAGALAPLGPVYAVAFAALAARSPLRTQWGVYLGVISGAAATVIGLALLLPRRRRAGPRTSPADGSTLAPTSMPPGGTP